MDRDTYSLYTIYFKSQLLYSCLVKHGNVCILVKLSWVDLERYKQNNKNYLFIYLFSFLAAPQPAKLPGQESDPSRTLDLS